MNPGDAVRAAGSDTSGDDRLAVGLVCAGLLLLAVPILTLSYLPLTDLPQHLAIATILAGLDDPATGFADFYRPADSALLRALPYAVQYGFVRGLSTIVPLELAMRCFVVLAALATPLAVLAMLRALHKPAWLALLAVPLVMNRAFFWGFSSFNLSIGVALFACALLARERWSAAAAWGVAALSTLVVGTHPYGVAVLLGYLGLWLLLGERREWLRRAPTAAPALAGAALWIASGAGMEGFGDAFSPALTRRIATLPGAVLGGYRDASEGLILLGWAVLAGVLVVRGRKREAAPALTLHEGVVMLYLLLNCALYLLVPQHTENAKFVHFRHAVIAAVLVPLVVPGGWLRGSPRLARALLVGLAAASIANGWVHLLRFDREARSFDGVLAAIPERPRLVALSFDRNGGVMRTVPYIHFAAYAQARKGGLVVPTFPSLFWNLPVRLRDDAGIPPTPLELEMRPRRYDYASFGYFYDYVLTRTKLDTAPLRSSERSFPFELIYDEPPWRLYRVLPGRTALPVDPLGS